MRIDLRTFRSINQTGGNFVMPWCPICKNEYVDGVKECADCHVGLVSQIEEELVPIIFGEEEEINQLNIFLTANEFYDAVIRPSEEESFFELAVPASLEKKAKKMVSVYSVHKAKSDILEKKSSDENGSGEQESDDEQIRPAENPRSGYTTQKEKAENYKTSAYTLIVVGILGLVFLVVASMGVLRISFGLLTYFIMGGMFLLFLLSGIASYRSYKKSSQEAVMENHLSKEIMEWCKVNLDTDIIDEMFLDEKIPDEIKYFKRIDKIKESIKETYLNLDDGFLDALVEEIYPVIFNEMEED